MLTDELFKKYRVMDDYGNQYIPDEADFRAALKEYGEAVREKAVRECDGAFKGTIFTAEGAGIVSMAKDKCAAAIKQMELP